MTYEDVIFQQKLSYLRRLLKIYVRFLKYYSDVEVEVLGNAKEGGFVPKTIEVKYCKAKNNGYTFQAIEFPVEHIGRRIVHYRAKVKNMVKNRHTNTGWMNKEGTFEWSDGIGSKITFVESKDTEQAEDKRHKLFLLDEEGLMEKVKFLEAKYGIDLSTDNNEE